jgi:hypothetical protein
MDAFKLRLKIGANEFEAEGSQEYVQGERQVFLESITANDCYEEPASEELGETPAGSDGGGQALPAAPRDWPISLTEMGKLAHQDKSDKDLIILTALPQESETQKQGALVLLLLAHKIIRNVDTVKSPDVLNGMKQSGIPVDRLDGVADKIPNLVLKTGVRKGTKYRLSTPGVQKAAAVAKALLSHVS